MPLETYTPPTDPAERFARIMDDLRKAVAESHARGVSGALILLIWTHLGRVKHRFARLVARIRAGQLSAPRKPRTPRAEADPPRPPRKPCLLPRGKIWLTALVGYWAAGYGSQIQYLLDTDPEMAALIAASPQLANLLRPLCRALGFDPVILRLPPRPPKPKQPRKPRAPRARAPRPDAPPKKEHRWGPYHWKCAKPPASGLIIGEKRKR
jgi:hypothetical protein